MRLIDADTLLKDFEDIYKHNESPFDTEPSRVKNMINKQPTVIPEDICSKYVPMQPIKLLKRFKSYHLMCPNCGMNLGIKPKEPTETVYCMLCGQAIDLRGN